MLSPGTFALTALLALLTAIAPLSMDLYLPSLPAIETDLVAPAAQVQLTISIYLIGFAVGQIAYGPISDRCGRKPVLNAALAIFCLGTLACALAPTILALIAARALQGAGSAGVIVLVRAVVRDLYEGPRAGRELALMAAIMSVAPILAPVIGGLIETSFGWRFGFILILVAGLAAMVVVWRLLPETARRDHAPGHPIIALARSYAVIGRSGGFLAYLSLATTSYAGLFAYISGSSFVLQSVYGLSPLAFGLFYGVTSLGFIAGTLIGAKRVTRCGFDQTIGLGAAALAGGGLVLIASVALLPSSVIAVAAPMMVFLAGLGLVLPLSMAAALQPFSVRAGAASSFLGVVQQTAGAISGVFVGHALGRTGWPMIFAIAAAGCVTLLLWFATRALRTKTGEPPA